jgi:hypothetical protein
MLQNRMRKPGDYIERATVLEVIQKRGRKRTVSQYRLRCDCGTEFTKAVRHVRAGKIIGCGCHWRFSRGYAGDGKVRHPLFAVWRAMIDRCHNPQAESFSRYGARGISVCDRWRWGEGGVSGFDRFVTDMGPKPSPTHSVERCDNSGNYEPRNCAWATKIQQSRNRRNVVRYSYDGKTQTLPEWSEQLGVGRGTLAYRLKRGWPIHKTFSQPTRHQ